MTGAFFITGLPMSRTTWLANLFTTGNVFCWHDLLGVVKDMPEFLRTMGTTAPRTGDADSGLLAVHERVIRSFPEAPWVLIERDFEDAWESLCAFVNAGPWQEKLSCTWELRQAMTASWASARAALAENARCIRVPFASLENIEMIEQIWNHCVPGYRFDRRRAMHLQSFSVRPHQLKAPVRPRLELIRELYPMERTM